MAPYRRHREFAHKPTQQVAPRGRDGAALRSPVRKGPNAHVEATLGDEGSAGYSSHAQGRKALNTSGHSGEVTALADQLKWPKKTNKYGIALKSHATQGRDFAESTEEVGEGRSGNIKHQRRPAMLGDFQREHTGATGVGIGDNDQRVRAWEALRSDPNFDGAHGQTSQEIAKTYAPPEVTGPAGSTTVGDPMASLAADYRASSRLEQYEAAGRFDGAAGLNTTDIAQKKNRERWQQDGKIKGVGVDKEQMFGASVGPRPPPNQRKQQILAGAAGVFTGTDIKHEAQFGGSLGQQLRQTSVMDFAGAAGASSNFINEQAPELRASLVADGSMLNRDHANPHAGLEIDLRGSVSGHGGASPPKANRASPNPQSRPRSATDDLRSSSVRAGMRMSYSAEVPKVVLGGGTFDDGATTVTKEDEIARAMGIGRAGATTHTINRDDQVTNASRYHHAERRKGDGVIGKRHPPTSAATNSRLHEVLFSGERGMAAWAEANVRGGAKGQGGAVAAVGGVGRGPGDARRMSMAYTKADEKYVEGAAGAGSEVIGALEPQLRYRAMVDESEKLRTDGRKGGARRKSAAVPPGGGALVDRAVFGGRNAKSVKKKEAPRDGGGSTAVVWGGARRSSWHARTGAVAQRGGGAGLTTEDMNSSDPMLRGPGGPDNDAPNIRRLPQSSYSELRGAAAATEAVSDAPPPPPADVYAKESELRGHRAFAGAAGVATPVVWGGGGSGWLGGGEGNRAAAAASAAAARRRRRRRPTTSGARVSKRAASRRQSRGGRRRPRLSSSTARRRRGRRARPRRRRRTRRRRSPASPSARSRRPTRCSAATRGRRRGGRARRTPSKCGRSSLGLRRRPPSTATAPSCRRRAASRGPRGSTRTLRTAGTRTWCATARRAARR